MNTGYEYLNTIVGSKCSHEQQLIALRGFARELRWTPSYEFRASLEIEGAENHLVVEHGLENSAVLSFFKSPAQINNLLAESIYSLLNLSYNNLVDWHIFISESEAQFFNNLADPICFDRQVISRSNLNAILSDNFHKVAKTAKIIKKIPNCESLLISTILKWKRLLKADYKGASNENLSTVMNSLIFIRSCEDQLGLENPIKRVLTSELEGVKRSFDLLKFFEKVLRKINPEYTLKSLINTSKLNAFKAFDRETAFEFFKDFYRPPLCPYDFNFAYMSKHALSRIYEKYVSLLEFKPENAAQLSFIPPVPAEKKISKTGAVFTPQFIASFFAKYLRDNMTPRKFRELKTIDPACGSGIFLRTILELQCDPFSPGVSKNIVENTFKGVVGYDRDPNACEATRLSLSLLFLVITGSLPNKIKIICGDSIRIAHKNSSRLKGFGAVLANPPYVKFEHLTEEEKELYSEYLDSERTGRVDSYLAFTKLCLEMVEPSGFVCLVLPHSFLFADNSSKLRRKISSEFFVRCLVDLSLIEVFEDFGIYNILLIVQKRSGTKLDAPCAQIVKGQEYMGAALDTCLDGKTIEGDFYDVYEVPQSLFLNSPWVILKNEEHNLLEWVGQFKPLSAYMNVRQGFVSGSDEIFIRKKVEVAKNELNIYKPFLPDREIFRYSIPKKSSKVVFYPFVEDKKISGDQLKKKFPDTWKYLKGKQPTLMKRGSVVRGNLPWWRPEGLRQPQNILRPKIICPHLILTPRFGLDLSGEFIISRSPVMLLKDSNNDGVFLKYFCGILNSSLSQWYIERSFYKYSRGYSRLEVSNLKMIPVPDPKEVPTKYLKKLIELVEKRVGVGLEDDKALEDQIDNVVFDLYALSNIHRQLFLREF